MTNNYTRNILLIFLLCSALFLLQSCEVGYGIANISDPAAPMHKPNYTDTTTQTTKAEFISAKLSLGEGYRETDNMESGSIWLYQSIVKKKYDLSTGAFAYFGNYQPNGMIAPFDQKVGFYGLGLSHEGNLRIGTRRKWWHIGYKTSLFYEDGAYDEFKRSADQTIPGFLHMHPSKLNFYLGYKVSLHPTENLGFYYSLGAITASETNPTLGLGTFLKHENWVFDVNVTVTDFAVANFGFHYQLK
ncbi:hypothetical protein [Roseivirga pacifica]